MVNYEQPEPKRAPTSWPKRILIVLAILGAIGYLVWDTFYRSSTATHAMALDWRETGRRGMVEGQVVDELDTPLGDLELLVKTPSGSVLGTTDPSGRFEIRLGQADITGLVIPAVGDVQWGIAGTTIGALDASDGLRFHIIVHAPPPPRARPSTRPASQPAGPDWPIPRSDRP